MGSTSLLGNGQFSQCPGGEDQTVGTHPVKGEKAEDDPRLSPQREEDYVEETDGLVTSFTPIWTEGLYEGLWGDSYILGSPGPVRVSGSNPCVIPHQFVLHISRQVGGGA